MRANVGVRSKTDRDFTTEQSIAIRSMLLAASRPHGAEIADATTTLTRGRSTVARKYAAVIPKVPQKRQSNVRS